MKREPKFTVGQKVKSVLNDRIMVIKSIQESKSIINNYKGISIDFNGKYICQWVEGDTFSEAEFVEETLIEA